MSVQRQFAQSSPSIVHVTPTGGNGSSLQNTAMVFLDMRISSVFRVDISQLTGTGGGDAFITLDTVGPTGTQTPPMPGALAGKEITILFSGNSQLDSELFIHFTENFGPNISTKEYILDALELIPTAMKLMSDGTDMVILSSTDGYF